MKIAYTFSRGDKTATLLFSHRVSFPMSSHTVKLNYQQLLLTITEMSSSGPVRLGDSMICSVGERTVSAGEQSDEMVVFPSDIQH